MHEHMIVKAPTHSGMNIEINEVRIDSEREFRVD